MATSAALRTHRTEARLLPHQKKRIEHAAAIKGISVSAFLVQTADEAAVRTIQEHESWVLSERDRDIFMEAVRNPPKPNPRLKAAVKRARQLIRQ